MFPAAEAVDRDGLPRHIARMCNRDDIQSPRAVLDDLVGAIGRLAADPRPGPRTEPEPGSLGAAISSLTPDQFARCLRMTRLLLDLDALVRNNPDAAALLFRPARPQDR
jgi:hypothetical protein